MCTKTTIKRILERIEQDCFSDRLTEEQYIYIFVEKLNSLLKSWDEVYPGRISEAQKAEFYVTAGWENGKPDMDELFEESQNAYLDAYI
jgi:hypothetical protein